MWHLFETAELQSWPELLGHKGNKPVKNDVFPPSPSPGRNVDVGHSSYFR